METREKFRQMVEYLLNAAPTKDTETIDNYTDSLMLGCEEYHQEQGKLFDLADVVGQSEQFICYKQDFEDKPRCSSQCRKCGEYECRSK